jgi:hypothetical protein
VSNYLSLTLYGGQTVNSFWLKNYSLNATELSAIKSSDTNWTWDYNTVAMCKFNNSLSAGNISLSELLDSWKIYRKNITTEDTLFTTVGETSTASIQSMRDYMVANGNTYQYMIVGKTDNYLSDAIYSDVVQANYFYWCLVDRLTHELWKFQLSIDNNNIEDKFTVNSSVTVTTTFSKYAVFSIGKPCYRSSSLSPLLGNIDSSGNYSDDTNKKRDALIAFLNNGREKILKTPRGDVLVVNTYTNDYSGDNKTIQMEQTISFNFVESASADDVSLFDEITS